MAMVGSWATSAASLAELDDALLPLHSPGFDDDDPSSYLLYPPGFGPVDDYCPPHHHPSPGFGGKGGHLGALPGYATVQVVRELGGGGGLSSDAPLPDDQTCLAGTWEEEEDCDGGILVFSSVPHADGAGSGTGSVVDEYMVAGHSSAEERDVDRVGRVRVSDETDVGVSCRCCVAADAGEEDGIGAREAPVIVSDIKVEEGDGDETHSPHSASSSSSSATSIGEKCSKEEGRDCQGDDDGNGDDRDGGKGEGMDELGDLEEGEIRALDAEAVAASADGNDEIGGMEVAARMKNELQIIPPVPCGKAAVESHLHTLPVGVISSIIGNKVIVEGLQKHNPLSKGCILWITKTRTPLGQVEEIFGPLKNPSYVVRYRSEEEIPAGISEGASVSFVIFDEPELHKKGYDASVVNYEVIHDEVKFSDGEKEAEQRTSLWQPKGWTDTMRQRNQKSPQKRSFQFGKSRAQFNNSGHLQAIPQPPHFPRQMRAPTQAPRVHGRLQSPLWQPCDPAQLQAQAPSPLHWSPGEYQAPFPACNNTGGTFPPFPGGGQVCLSGPPVVHTVPYWGEPGGPFRFEQQNLLMQESNACWGHGSPQQFNMGLSIMLPVNGMPGQQPQDLHSFHQHHNQAFQRFTNGIPSQHHYSPNQGMPHSISWQGVLPSPPVPLRCMGSTGHGSFSQAASGHMSACEEGVFGLPNGNQNLAQFQLAMGQGNMHPAI